MTKFIIRRTSNFWYLDDKPCEEAKREDKETFTIEINSLEELMKFIRKYGKIVLFPDKNNALPTIEIYDDYRE